jgi:photosystem II stability/assembly factor-like uncharacterized protein
MNMQRLALLLLGVVLAGCSAAPPRTPQAWRMLSTGSSQSLRGMSAVDATVAVVGGANGTLLRTEDGGHSWNDIAPAGSEQCDFRDVEALDRNQIVALVAGQPARLYRSEDAGHSWRIVHQDPRPAAFFDAVAFAGEHGVMFGDAIDGSFCLLVTTDGGRTWGDRSSMLLPNPEPSEAAFAASGTCLVAADAETPRFTLVTGGGPSRMISLSPSPRARESHWSVALPLQTGSSSQGAFSIAWNGECGVVVGGDYKNPNVGTATVACTLDGGQHWLPGDAGGFRSAVLWLDDKCLLAVGSHGASYSADMGRSWARFGETGFHSLCLGRDGAVWACGSDGRVARLQLSE